MKAIILARVSDPKQQEGHSIDAQLQRVTDYVERRGFIVNKQFSFQETASHKIRKNFEEIIKFIGESEEPVAIVADTVDRITRNFRDAVRIDELRFQGKVEIHCLRENLIISKTSNSTDILRWDMGVMFAKNYILNIGDNVKRSQEQMLLSGKWPSKPPLGYISARDDQGNRDIEVDSMRGPMIRKAFEWYATGRVSMNEVCKRLEKVGMHTDGNKSIQKSLLDQILSNPFYFGSMRWNNKIYEGSHSPLITRDLWQQVQDAKAGYHKKPFKYAAKDFSFRGLITCARCGCTITGEIKKGKYIYWHCTNYHGNCKRTYIPQDELDKQILVLLKNLHIPQNKVLELVADLKAIHEDKSAFEETSRKILQDEYQRIQRHIDQMYDDKLDGRITTDQYDNLLQTKKQRQQKIIEELERHRRADKNYYVTAERLLFLASVAAKLYKSSKPDEKRELVGFLLSNLQLDGRILRYTVNTPFDAIAKYAPRQAWLPRLDSNQRHPRYRNPSVAKRSGLSH